MAKLTFYGAVEGVTGSMYLLETEKSRVLLECGLYQGGREEEKANSEEFPFDVRTIDAVVLSHSHLDHSGRLPILHKRGFEESIFMTWATLDLLEVLLKDAAFLQKKDAEWENRRRRRSGKEEIKPLYMEDDVERVLQKCVGQDFNQRFSVTEDVSVCFQYAGHILGSAIVQLFIDEGGEEKRLVFSGDLGNSNIALLNDPQVLEDANLLLLETTYGNRNHRSLGDTLLEFESIMSKASADGGNILIPAFSVGRTQEIIFRLGQLYQEGKLKNQVVYLDSPMAIAVTEIYHRYQHAFNRDDRETMGKNLKTRSLHQFLPILKYSSTTEESMSLNNIEAGAIIIAGSGMCNGGRIRHHLKHNLWRRNTHVIIVGYQAMGTLGRKLVDGLERVTIAGEDVVVKAHIHTLGGFSAHASQSQLTEWLNNFKKSSPQLCLVHGEEKAKNSFRKHIAKHGWDAFMPEIGESVLI
jgi:metallo-beta-lactamase family protein